MANVEDEIDALYQLPLDEFTPARNALAKRLVKVPHIGLVNVVAGREVAPEFIQDNVVPEKMADVLVELLRKESPRRQQMLSGLAEVRAKLGSPGAADRVARIASDLVGPQG